MDRRNGGDSLAPPRPPKSLPRVHRPRAPEPPMMSASNLETNSTTVILHSCNIPQQIQHQQQPPQFQQQQQQQQLQSHNQICTNNHIHPNRNNNNIINSNINNNLNRPNSSNSNIVNSNINSNNILNNLNSNSNSNNNNNNINNNLTAQRAPLTAPLIPLHSSINNNSNISNINIGSTTPSTNLTSSNSFTRRRPQTPVIGLQILPPPTTPLLSSSNLILHSNINNNESSSISPVTLAAPRPENERLSNEYVDTPLRSATTANLHHATRIQHPAGQTIRGQTTTSHNLLQNQRQHLQLHNSNTHNHHHQPQHHQIHFNSTTSHSNNIFNNHNSNINISSSNNERHRQTSNVPSSISTVGGGSAGSSSGTLRQVISSGVCGIDGSSNTLHSNNISHKNIISSSISSTACEDSTSTTISPTIASITHPPTTTSTTANNQNQRVIPGTMVRQSHQSQQQQSTNHHSSTTLPITEPITKQPPFSKDCLSASILHEELDLHHLGSSNTTTGNIGSGGLGGNSGNSTNHSDYLNSITCPQCKKCRCEQCQSPRQLPSKWVCNKTCLCSAETVIDYASCLCCVKALFYHCSKDHEMECEDGTDSISCADDPCSCLPHKRATRWGWLGALSLALPCLWFYWPMRGFIAICAKCYARHSRHGCRCNNYQSQIGSTSSMLPIAPAHGNQIIASKSSGVGSGNSGNGGNGGSGSNGGGCVGSGINLNSSSHHQHHFNNSGVSRIIRTNDLTPEKRLLDSSPEY